MKVINKTNGNKCKAKVIKTGWAVEFKRKITFYSEEEFARNYVILL